MIHTEQLDRLPGMNVIGSDGDDIGKVDEVYVDDATGEPSFALVNTGLFGLKSSFVPLDQADITGEDLKVAATKDKVKDAPSIDPDGHLSPDEEDELYRYYGLRGPSDRSMAETGQPREVQSPTETGRAVVGQDRSTVGRSEPVGDDPSVPTTDDAMTRSEEELHVSTHDRVVGKARLRKHIVTDHVTKTIPVQREVITVEREPVDESDVGRATGGPDLAEDEHEIILHEEELVIEKRTVPKERVRLGKETHTEQQIVEDDVRKEEIDVARLENPHEDPPENQDR